MNWTLLINKSLIYKGEIMELDQVTSSEDCEKIASMDTYDDDERLAWWCACLVDVLDSIKSCRLMGHQVKLIDITQRGGAILAKVSSGKSLSYVAIDSLDMGSLAPYQRTWLKAYEEYFS